MRKTMFGWELKEKFDIIVDFKHFDEFMIMAFKNHKRYVVRDTNGFFKFCHR